jgi:hypothetical protein
MRSGMLGIHRIYDFAVFCLPWSALCFLPLLPLPLILLLLILALESCILILLCSPSHQCTASKRGQSRSSEASPARASTRAARRRSSSLHPLSTA